jgi:hypothetical protein
METSDQLIEKIQTRQVRPLPRWRHVFKDTLSWVLFILCALVGSLAFSVILFVIQQVDFDLISHMGHSRFELLLGLVPFFWIIAMVVLLVLAILSIKNSKKGYKFTSLSLIGLSVAFSILLGTLFFISGGGNWLENAFAIQVQTYESVQERKLQVWSDPENGFLSGTIINPGDSTFELRDFKGTSWIISHKGADIVPAVTLEDGEKIKMMGKITSENHFSADMIRPWGGGQRRFHGGWKNN